MNLPPKAINLLLAFKADLVKKPEPESVTVTVKASPKAQKESRVRIRHARSSGAAFQRMCRRKDWASPVY